MCEVLYTPVYQFPHISMNNRGERRDRDLALRDASANLAPEGPGFFAFLQGYRLHSKTVAQ
jgi:hypothetical protein